MSNKPTAPASIDDVDLIDTILRDYRDGSSILSLSKEHGLGRSAIRSLLIAHDVPLRGYAQNGLEQAKRSRYRLETFPAEAICAAYQQGQSLRGLAAEHGCSMRTVKRILAKGGICLRGRYELQIQRLRSEFARGHQARQAHQPGQSELLVESFMLAKGLHPVRQGVVGPYNIDMLLPSVAVEVHAGAGNPISIARERKRIVQLTEWGWDVFYIWITVAHPVVSSIADDLISWLELSNRHPTSRGRYRVIRGSGQLVAEGGSDLDDLADIQPSVPA